MRSCTVEEALESSVDGHVATRHKLVCDDAALDSDK